MVALLQSVSESSLRTLLLNGNPTGGRTLDALASTASLSSLEELDLDEEQLGECGAEILRRSPFLPRATVANLLEAF